MASLHRIHHSVNARFQEVGPGNGLLGLGELFSSLHFELVGA